MSKGYYDRQRKKHITIVVIAAAFCLLLFLVSYVVHEKQEDFKSGYGTIEDVNPDQDEIVDEQETEEVQPLRCLVIDVGDALSVLIDYGDKEILYDCGYAENGKKVSKAISPYVNGRIDYLILSHSHADHVGGAVKVLEDYEVDTAIVSGEKKGTSKEFDDAMAALDREGCKVMNDADMSFDLGDDAVLDIIETYDPGDTDVGDNPNNLSVVAHFSRGQDSILLTGDSETLSERALKGKISNVSVFVAGHHMSKTANNILLLREWAPSCIIASCAGPKESEYGFPHKQAVARCMTVTDKIYATYISGDILVEMDGDGNINTNCNENDKLTVGR